MENNEKEVKSKAKRIKEDWHEITKRVWIPKNKAAVNPDFIPKDILFKENKKILEQVGIAIGKNMPVLLIGETGTGKTSLVRHLAFQTNNAFVRVNHNGGTTVEDLVGRWLIDSTGQTIWVDGILIEAVKQGYWFHGDELNAASADINFLYHSLLDDDGRIILAEKGNEVVIPHKNFRFFAAINPTAEYAGAKDLNKALVDRFIVVKMDFPEPEVEIQILCERTGIEQDVATQMVSSAGQIRIMQQKGEVQFIFSTRTLLQWAEMYKVYRKYLLASEMTVLNKIGPEDFEAIRDTMGLNFKALDEKSEKIRKSKVEATPEPEVI